MMMKMMLLLLLLLLAVVVAAGGEQAEQVCQLRATALVGASELLEIFSVLLLQCRQLLLYFLIANKLIMEKRYSYICNLQQILQFF